MRIARAKTYGSALLCLFVFGHAMGCGRGASAPEPGAQAPPPPPPQAQVPPPPPSHPPVPVMPGLFTPFSEPSELEVKNREEIVAHLWKSPLGQMYRAFLFDPVDPADVPHRSRELASRAFKDRGLVITRINALQLLTADLYSRNVMNGDVADRILLLEGEFSSHRLSTEQIIDANLVQQAAYFIILSIPYGSPVVREEMGKVVKGLFSRARLIGRRETSAAPVPGPEWRRLFSTEVFKGYQVGHSVSFFFNTYGPYSLAYIFLADRLGKAGVEADQELVLWGLDSLLHLREL